MKLEKTENLKLQYFSNIKTTTSYKHYKILIKETSRKKK